MPLWVAGGGFYMRIWRLLILPLRGISLRRVGLTLVGWMEARVRRGIWRLLLVSLPYLSKSLRLGDLGGVYTDDEFYRMGRRPFIVSSYSTAR